MSYIDLPPIIEKMLNVSDSVSDLNFSVGRVPQVEVNGKLTPVDVGLKTITPYHTEIMAMALIGDNTEAAEKLIKTGSTDISYSLPMRSRFRVNIFRQRGTLGIVMRVIPPQVPSLASLDLPAQLGEITELKNGLVLVTGPTGSGKSSSLAAIINKFNLEKPYHIITIEDPIEFLHLHRLATINQRELGSDTPNFAMALRAALRQAPKVILVGEMRDIETTEIALEAAETGHLVLSTLHTIDAAKTIDRIIGMYPKNEESVIRTRLAQTFRYIISQRLIPRVAGGRVAAVEILKSTPRTREYIERGEGEGRSLVQAMEDGTLDGMQSFDMVIERLIHEKIITREDGLAYSTNPHNMALRLSGFGGGSVTEELQNPVRSAAPAMPAASAPLSSLISKY
ncbi:MAG TPA: PilT/PilU family type 4a pilus ATPase [Blastocatellia bacterium]|nr:PilT/PilU family type 4a pilus ATPase [Blastocatellia bacterium]